MKTAAFRFTNISRKQRQVLNWWTAGSPVRTRNGIIADGAIRSGKTLSMSLSFVFWAMHTFDGEQFGMCGKTIHSFRRNVLRDLKRILPGRGYRIIDHRADNYIVIQRGSVSNTFFIFSGRDERSQDLVQGVTLAGVFFDEVALMPRSFVDQATGRCSVDGSTLWFNCNPDGPQHWFKKQWLDRADELGLLHLHFTMDDNPSLSEAIRERFRRLYSGVFFKRYILGLWVMAEGVIYDMFDSDIHVVDQLPKFVPGECYVSCDYGTQNALVFLLWKKGVDGAWYCCREYYYSGRDKQVQKTDTMYADDFKCWIGDERPLEIIIDPSAASFIAEMKKRGYRVHKGKNDVFDGIRVVSSLLANRGILIHSSCEATIREFYGYVWDPKAADRGKEEPVKLDDHAMDAIRYFCYTILYKARKISVFK